MSERLCHDIAWAVAHHIVEVFAPLLREEEQREAFAEVYQRVKAGLECYECQVLRTMQRLRPGRN
jgi:hypothetical protein